MIRRRTREEVQRDIALSNLRRELNAGKHKIERGVGTPGYAVYVIAGVTHFIHKKRNQHETSTKTSGSSSSHALGGA